MYRLLFFLFLFGVSSCSDDSGHLFQKVNVLENTLSIDIPTSFRPFTTPEVKSKFSSTFRPKEVWGDPEKNLWVSFFCVPSENADSLTEIVEKTRSQYETFKPEVISVKVNGQDARRLSMIIPGQDGTEMNTTMQFLPLDNNILVIDFSVSLEHSDEHKQTGKKILNSVHVNP